MTSEAINSALKEVNEDMLLAEGHVQRVHPCRFSLLWLPYASLNTQNEAMGASPQSLAVAALIDSLWVSIVKYLMHKY